MADSVYHLVLLSLQPECSRHGLLSLAELWYLFCVWLRIRYQTMMAPVIRVEPYEITLLSSNPALAEKVRNVGWMQFFEKFSDLNPEVNRVFSLSLVNYQAEVGDLCFQVDERSIAAATGLSLTGQRWFKY